MIDPATPEAAAPRADGVACALCQQTIPADDRPERFVNNQQVCARCEQQVLSELEAQRPDASAFPLAILGGAVGALIAAGVWAGIAIATDFEVGYVAVLVGFLAGFGVKLGARGKRGLPLQLLATVLSVGGLVVAKYFMFSWFAVKGAAAEGVAIGHFDPLVVSGFFEFLPKMLSGFDILWVILAVGAAYRTPAPSPVKVIRV
jgi:hypothetical protein